MEALNPFSKRRLAERWVWILQGDDGSMGLLRMDEKQQSVTNKLKPSLQRIQSYILPVLGVAGCLLKNLFLGTTYAKQTKWKQLDSENGGSHSLNMLADATQEPFRQN